MGIASHILLARASLTGCGDYQLFVEHREPFPPTGSGGRIVDSGDRCGSPPH